MTEIDSKVALVTGANRGIGRAVVTGLADRGWTVYLGARNEEDAHRGAAELRRNGGDVRGIRLDLTDAETLSLVASTIMREVGRLDALVNNAGIGGSPEAEQPGTANVDVIRRVFETNVLGTIAVTEAMLPLLRRSPRARIVNVSSSTGSLTLMSDKDHYFAGMPGWLGYPASKAAVNQITVQYAKHLREEGIVVNAADPGPTNTSLTDAAPNTTRARPQSGRTPEEGAQIIIDLATSDGDATGEYRRNTGALPW